MRSLHRATTLAFCALVAGCATVNTVRLGPERYEPVDPAQVRIFATVAPKHYTEVAILTSVNEIFNNEGRVAEKMRRAAARLGANGILLLSDRPGYGDAAVAVKVDSSVVVTPAGSGYSLGRVIAIRYDARTETAAREP
jgi:hypothetical protein